MLDSSHKNRTEWKVLEEACIERKTVDQSIEEPN